MVEQILSVKKCFKCELTLPLSEFYRDSGMVGGVVGKCKGCTRLAVRENRLTKREQYQEYERLRAKTPTRKLYAVAAQERRRERNPEKYKARTAVGNALRDGLLVRADCEVCGSANSQAHHADYSKPLEVRWLCFAHHRMEHGQLSHLKQVAQYRAER